jgi:hypothetical protein
MKKFCSFLIVLAFIVVGLGFYRGWFTLSGSREAESQKVDVNLKVDPDKVKADAETVKDGLGTHWQDNRRRVTMNWLGTKNLGMLLLGIWLVVTGLLQFVHISFANTGPILAVLAIAAGSLILLGR